MELKTYETVFIMTPVLSDDQIKDTVKKYKDILETRKSKIVQLDKYKLRKLAYNIDHKSMGIYQVIEFQAEPTTIADLEKEYRRDEKIIRFLTVSLDKHGIEYNRKKREMSKLEKPIDKEQGSEDKSTKAEKISTSPSKKVEKVETPIAETTTASKKTSKVSPQQ